MHTHFSADQQQYLEELWANVQPIYATSRHYRAGDSPEYAKALAEFDRVANGLPASNVIQFVPLRGRRK